MRFVAIFLTYDQFIEGCFAFDEFVVRDHGTKKASRKKEEGDTCICSKLDYGSKRETR